MSRWTLFLTAVAATSCGNYSNDDVEFLNALPHESDLTVKLPSSATSASALNTPDGGPPCGDQLGSPSCFFENTVALSGQINTSLFFLLGVVDAIEQFPPTSRTLNTRTWGPLPSDTQPGFDVEVVIARSPPHQYDYAIQFQKHGSPSGTPWFPFIQGAFDARGGARRGDGGIAVDGQGAVAFGLDTGTLGSGVLQGAYDTTGSPYIRVAMRATQPSDAGPINTLTYESHEYVDSTWGPDAGTLNFVVPMQTDAGVLTMLLHTQWDFTGIGRGDAVVLDPPPYTGMQGLQCWGTAPLFPIVFEAESWNGGAAFVGDAGICPPFVF